MRKVFRRERHPLRTDGYPTGRDVIWQGGNYRSPNLYLGFSLRPDPPELPPAVYTVGVFPSKPICQMASSLPKLEMKRVGRNSLGSRECLHDASRSRPSGSPRCLAAAWVSSSHRRQNPELLSFLKLQKQLCVAEPSVPTILFPVLQTSAWLYVTKAVIIFQVQFDMIQLNP